MHRLIWLRWLEWLMYSDWSVPQVKRARQGNPLPQGGAGFIRMTVKGGWSYLSWFPTLSRQVNSSFYRNGALLCLQELNLEYQPAFLGPSSFQGLIPSVNRANSALLKPRVLILLFSFCSPPQDPELLPELQTGCLKPGERKKNKHNKHIQLGKNPSIISPS